MSTWVRNLREARLPSFITRSANWQPNSVPAWFRSGIPLRASVFLFALIGENRTHTLTSSGR